MLIGTSKVLKVQTTNLIFAHKFSMILSSDRIHLLQAVAMEAHSKKKPSKLISKDITKNNLFKIVKEAVHPKVAYTGKIMRLKKIDGEKEIILDDSIDATKKEIELIEQTMQVQFEPVVLDDGKSQVQVLTYVKEKSATPPNTDSTKKQK